MSAMSPAISVSGRLNALNNVYELPAGGASVITIQTVPTFGTLTIIAEGSLDGTNWVALGLWDVTANAFIAGATGLSAVGKTARVRLDGIVRARLRVSAFTSGDAPVLITLADEMQGAVMGNC